MFANERARIDYTGSKLNAIRWWDAYEDDTSLLLTGSFDELPNRLSLWSFAAPPPVSFAGDTDERDDNDDDDDELGDSGDTEPRRICSTVHDGDITDLEFLSFLPNSFVCASSTGALSIYSIDSRPSADSAFDEWILQLDSQHEQPALRHQGSATALTVDQTNHTIATVGEDGYVHVFHPENETATKYRSAAVSLTDVHYQPNGHLLTSSITGLIHVWDTKQSLSAPVMTFRDASKPESFLHCLAPHPNYLYYVATGDSAGNLSIWDTRNSQMPFVSHRHHQSNIWDLKFDTFQADRLFSCAQDGNLFLWDFNYRYKHHDGFAARDNVAIIHLVEHIAGLNSIALHRNSNILAASSDNEALLSGVLVA